MDSKNKRTYTGRSGQMAVIAELLMRECNVAVPEIDVGEDVLTFQDGQPSVDRIQVKTANATRHKRNPDKYTARVSIPLKQLILVTTPELYYVFAVRLEDRWMDFIIISRFDLNELHQNEEVGRENKAAGELQLTLKFGTDSLTCDGKNMSHFQNAWVRLPVLSQPEAAVAELPDDSGGQPPGGIPGHPDPSQPQG